MVNAASAAARGISCPRATGSKASTSPVPVRFGIVRPTAPMVRPMKADGAYQRGQLQVRQAVASVADLELGAQAPTFELPEPLTGNTWKLSDFEGGKALLVMIISNHCPYVVLLKESLTELAKEYMAKGVKVVAISSNSVQTHPKDGPEPMAEDAKKYGYPFPYLYDATQDVARAYGGACTPEFYVFDSSLKLAHHGQYDDARPGSKGPDGKRGPPIGEVTGKDLRAALDAVLEGKPAPVSRPSIGCGIKWHPTN